MYIPVKLTAENFQSFESLSYDFQQGKSVLIQGENLSDDGQESNGAGKSTLQEIVYYCIIGSSSTGKRDVKLIRRGETESNISLTLYNPISKETLKIERTLFLKKSSTLNIFVNEKDQKHLFSTIDDGNKFLLSLIDISSDDIKNFYLINRERFTPFFKLSDTQSRLLISRFANISFITDIETVINKEIEEQGVILNELLGDKRDCENNILSYQSKIDALQDQIKSVKESSSPEKVKQIKESAINNIKIEIHKFETEIEYYLKSIEGLKKSINEQEELKRDYENNRILIDRTIDRLNNINYAHKREAINNEVKKYEESIDTLKHKIVSIEKIVSDYSKEVRSLEITLSGAVDCPKCKHNFIPESEIDTNEAKLLINEINKEIDSNNLALENFNKKRKSIEIERNNILSGLRKIDEQDFKRRKLISFYEKSKLNYQLQPIESKISSYSREINNSTNSIELLQNKIRVKENDIENIKNESNDNTLVIKNLNDSINNFSITLDENIRILNEVEIAIEKQSEIIENKRIWLLYFKQFYIYLTNQCLKKIQDLCNNFLEQIDTNLRVKVEGFKQLASGDVREKITTVILRDDIEEDDYRSFSGGERGKLTLSTILAFQELINSNSKSGGLDILFIDEILDSVDGLGMKNFIEALNKVQKTIHLTTHISIKERDENVILIRKVNDKSYIV